MESLPNTNDMQRTQSVRVKPWIDAAAWFVILLFALAWNAASFVINPIALLMSVLACLRLAVVASRIGGKHD